MASASATMLMPSRGSVAQKIDGTYAGRNLPNWIDPDNGEVQVLLLSAASGNSLPKSPFVVRKSIEKAVGDIDSARTEARGTRYVLKVRKEEQVNRLLQLKQLIDGTNIDIVHHPVLNVRKCVVTCRGVLEMEEEELKADLREQKVIDVRRITRRGETNTDMVKTATLILTVQGTVIPEYIYFGYIRVATRNYYPTPMQCFNCFRFGHTAARCTNPKLCRNCSKVHNGENCGAVSSCINCTEDHMPTDRNCPIRKQEVEIIRIRVEQGTSYGEAKKIYETETRNQQSYAQVSRVQERLLQYRSSTCKCQCSCNNESREKQPVVLNISPEPVRNTLEVNTPMVTEEAEKLVKRKSDQQKNQKTKKQASLSPPPSKTTKTTQQTTDDSDNDIMVGSEKKQKKITNEKSKSPRIKKRNG